MSALIDTGIFVGFHNFKDLNHENATKLIREVIDGEHGGVYTTDYIFDEAVTTALIRTGRYDIARELGGSILGEKVKFVDMIQIDINVFLKSWDFFKKFHDKKLSFTDCVSIAVVKDYDLDGIISFDKGFDGIIPRFC